MLTIFLPILVIHFLFSFYPTNNLWVAKWSAGELLSYFGSIIGALATIVAVVITIVYTKRSQDEQNVLTIKPYLQVKHTSFDTLDELCECKHCNYSFLIIRYGVTMYSAEPYDILNETNADTWEQFYEDNCVLKYTIKNIGANTAIDVKWNLNNNQIVFDLALSKDESKEFIIIINKSVLQNKEFNLNFEFNYSDVLSLARYSQKELIKIMELRFGLCSTQTKNDFLSSPKRIK